jgi:translation initiation factor eIF-2B subunit beta
METTVLMRLIVSVSKFDSLEDLISIVKAAGRQLVGAQPKGSSRAHFSSDVRLMGHIEHTVGNVVRRILRLIREEWSATAGKASHSSTRPITPDLPLEPAPERFPTPTAPKSSHSPFPSALPSRLKALRSSQYSLSGFVLHGKPHREGPGALAPWQEPTKTQAVLLSPEVGTSRKAQSIKPALIDAIQEVIDELETVYGDIAKNSRDHIHSEWVELSGIRSVLTGT